MVSLLKLKVFYDSSFYLFLVYEIKDYRAMQQMFFSILCNRLYFQAALNSNSSLSPESKAVAAILKQMELEKITNQQRKRINLYIAVEVKKIKKGYFPVRIVSCLSKGACHIIPVTIAVQ